MGAALVTGASGGIGKALALECAADGHDVVLVARNAAELRELASLIESRHRVRATTIPADLASPETSPAILEQLRSLGINVDILINNAGFGALGPFLSVDQGTHLRMIEVNITAPTALTRMLIPAMVQRKHGYVMNVSSTAAFQPGPWMSVYYASKAYLLHFTEALADELRGTGVTVTALCPGPTRTEFQEAAGMGDPKALRRPLMEADTVARIGYRGMKCGKRIVVPGLANRLAAQAYRFAPRRLLTSVTRWILKP